MCLCVIECFGWGQTTSLSDHVRSTNHNIRIHLCKGQGEGTCDRMMEQQTINQFKKTFPGCSWYFLRFCPSTPGALPFRRTWLRKCSEPGVKNFEKWPQSASRPTQRNKFNWHAHACAKFKSGLLNKCLLQMLLCCSCYSLRFENMRPAVLI